MEDLQTKPIIAISEASQCGKTKLFYSTACDKKSGWAVVNTRFVQSSISAGAKAVLSLENSLRLLSEKRRSGVTLHLDALCFIRAFILSHLLWLLVISERQKTYLRMIWSHALRNGDSAKVVNTIYKSLTEGIILFCDESRKALEDLWEQSLQVDNLHEQQ